MKYNEILNQFNQKWLDKNKGNPNIKAILKITPPTTLSQKFENYKQKVIQKRPNLKLFANASAGNTVRRFHGITLACSLHQTLSVCSNSNCVVCSISQKGFLMSYTGYCPSLAMKFGPGGDKLYFTAISSKANDYGKNTENFLGKGMRCVFLCYVVAGQGHKRLQDDKSPLPTNCDSVLGEVGGNLNYDEIIVYDESAAIPAYCIIYQL